jgi:hypothetical protein
VILNLESKILRKFKTNPIRSSEQVTIKNKVIKLSSMRFDFVFDRLAKFFKKFEILIDHKVHKKSTTPSFGTDKNREGTVWELELQ